MLNLTLQERQVLIFILFFSLLGSGIKSFAQKHRVIREKIYLEENLTKLDINSADKSDLVSLPGIGEKLAARIIEYRDANGRLTAIIQLKAIKGLNGKKFEKIKDLIIVR